MEVRTVGTKSNRSGIGARLSVKTRSRVQIDEIRSGSSYLSNNDMRAHFGLGANAEVEYLEVRWPSGLVERFRAQNVDSIVTVKEGTGKLVQATSPNARADR